MKTSCGRKIASLGIISSMLFDLTREAGCEDMSCLATFFEICGHALDSEPNSKRHMDTIFQILSKEITDANAKKQFDKLCKWRLDMPNTNPLEKVYLGLIIKGTIPRVPPFSIFSL